MCTLTTLNVVILHSIIRESDEEDELIIRETIRHLGLTNVKILPADGPRII